MESFLSLPVDVCTHILSKLFFRFILDRRPPATVKGDDAALLDRLIQRVLRAARACSRPHHRYGVRDVHRPAGQCTGRGPIRPRPRSRCGGVCRPDRPKKKTRPHQSAEHPSHACFVHLWTFAYKFYALRRGSDEPRAIVTVSAKAPACRSILGVECQSVVAVRCPPQMRGFVHIRAQSKSMKLGAAL